MSHAHRHAKGDPAHHAHAMRSGWRLIREDVGRDRIAEDMATLHARLPPDADAEASIAAIKRRLAKVHGIGHATVETESGAACPDVTEKWRANGTA